MSEVSVTISPGLGPPRTGRPLTLILKGTNRCNGACTFCSVGSAGRDSMSSADLERLIRDVDQLIDRWDIPDLQVIFHGGEPTMLGAAWIDHASERFRALPTRVRLGMQTNLLHFPDDLVDVARRREIKIGSSIDPLAGARLRPDGTDSFPTWRENYGRLSDLGFRIGAIFVVTRDAVGREPELFESFLRIDELSEHRFGAQLNPVYAQGRAATDDGVSLEADAFATFMIEMWRLWQESDQAIGLSPIEQLHDTFIRHRDDPPRLACVFRGDCSRAYVGIDHDLTVAGCGRRLDTHSYLGNLRDGDLVRILEEADEIHQIRSRADLLHEGECRDCRWWDFCHGGCPDDAHVHHDELLRRWNWCESYQRFFSFLDEHGAGRPEAAEDRSRRGRTDGSVTVQLLTSLGDAPRLPGSTSRRERWVAPRPDGSAPARDDVVRLLTPKTDVVRLWLRNDQVAPLAGWGTTVTSPRLRVMLFEGGPSLLPALDLLNRLGALVALDLPRLIESDPEANRHLSEVLDRYLHDPDWELQVSPFSEVLQQSLDERSRAALTNEWGIARDRLSFQPETAGADLSDPEARHLLERLERATVESAETWLEGHAACVECPHHRVCGGRFTTGERPACPPEALAVVDRLHRTGLEIRERLADQLPLDPSV